MVSQIVVKQGVFVYSYSKIALNAKTSQVMQRQSRLEFRWVTTFEHQRLVHQVSC